jgi:hypothetical protein
VHEQQPEDSLKIPALVQMVQIWVFHSLSSIDAIENYT